jgi:SHS2 domain-containing protein
MEKFEFLEHPADIKFRAYGNTIGKLFENVALAVSFYLSSGVKIEPRKCKTIEVKGEDSESLLYNFVDELIYLLEVDKFVVSKAEITMRGYNLKAEIYGDNASKYEIKQIKASTYAEMYIKKIKTGKEEHWGCQMVLDV